jgi:hypothetical protein
MLAAWTQVNRHIPKYHVKALLTSAGREGRLVGILF